MTSEQLQKKSLTCISDMLLTLCHLMRGGTGQDGLDSSATKLKSGYIHDRCFAITTACDWFFSKKSSGGFLALFYFVLLFHEWGHRRLAQTRAIYGLDYSFE